MGDKIAVMNDGVVEQLGSPREIYDRPASMFVADFIGSPPMNFVEFEAPLRQGDRCVVIDGAEIAVPELRETASQPECVLGVRPEHVRLSDTSPLRGSIYGAEYLGTTQIVTVATGHGFVKARLTSETAVRLGEPVGLAFRPEKLSIFDRRSGRVLRSALHDGGAHG